MADQQTRARGAAPQGSERPREEILLGRYRVLERRGTGGFGSVCTCWDTRLQRRVAIKRMPLAAETGTTAEEALAEARTACMLAHPNIVTVFDFEAHGSYAYLVMEYVDGLNLAELLARVEGGRLTPDECAHVLDSVARALDRDSLPQTVGAALDATAEMAEKTGLEVIASGGIAAMSDLEALGKRGVYGAILGRSIYEGKIDLREALARFGG